MTAAVEKVLNNLGIEDEVVSMKSLDEAPPPRGETSMFARMDNAASVPIPQVTQQSEPIVPIPTPSASSQEAPQSWEEAKEKKPTKEKAYEPKAPHSLRQLGPVLGKALPGAERVRVHKRMPNGTLGYVGDYTADHIGTMDMESFLEKYAKPAHGPGEYELTGITALGKTIDAGFVTLLGPIEHKSNEANALSLVQDLLQRQEKQQEKFYNMMNQQPQIPPPDPINLLRGVMDVQKNLNDQTKSESQGGLSAAMKAMSEQGSNTVQMMMAMMQQQQAQAQAQAQQQMQMMMAMMQQPKTDPIMVTLLQKLMEKPAEAPSMMMPPPPPQADPMESLTKTIQLVAELVKPREDPDRLTTRDIIELVRGGSSGGSDFETVLKNTGAIMGLANNLKQATEPGASSGFWDALTSLFGNREFAATLAQGVRAKALPQAGGMQAAPQTQLPPQVVEYLKKMKERSEQQDEALRKQAEVIQQLQKRLLSAPQAASQTPPQETPAVAVTPSPAESEGADAAASASPPEIPQEVLDQIHLIEEAFRANDEMKMIEETINLLDVIEGIPGFWNNLAKHIFDAIKENDKKKVLEYVSAFFESFNRMGILVEGVYAKIVALVDEHFEMIAEEIDSGE